MSKQLLNFENSGLTKKEWQTLKSLNTPKKIQDYLNRLPFNFEEGGETHRSVKETLKAGRAHCFEGALLASAALWARGGRPLLLDLKVTRPDFDHVVALFQENGRWGAISKTNHTILRYREPVYKSVRELAMSYFHEYFLEDGSKTMRAFSKPFDLSRFAPTWISGGEEENLAWLAHELDKSPHEDVLLPGQSRRLRPVDQVEREVLKIVEYKK